MTTTVLSFTEFASKSFIKQACSNPMTPQSVLSFFFGVNLLDKDDNVEKENAIRDMKNGIPMNKMSKLWYNTNTEYDKLCQSFIPTIRMIGKEQNLINDDNSNNKNDDDADENKNRNSNEFNLIWNSSIDGKVAQMIACDQLSRNCFRGTDEAFAYDDIGCKLSKELILHFLPQQEKETTLTTVVLEGEFYAPYIMFLISPMMHSEQLENHELALKVFNYLENDTTNNLVPEHTLPKINYSKKFLLHHKEVIDRFGRYPHRNKKLNRVSTSDELEWLADVDNLPGWAQSQG